MPLWGMLVVTVVLLGIPAFAVLVARMSTPDSSRLGLYVATPGVVTGTDVMTVSAMHFEPGSFVPVVWYRYTVKGMEYTGSRVQVSGPSFRLLGQAQDYAKRWAAAGNVTVWYDPADPGLSVLAKTPGVRGGAWAMGGLFGTVVGVLLLVVWVQWWKRRRVGGVES